MPIVLCTVTVRSIGKDVLAKAWGLCKRNIIPDQGREEDSPEVALDFSDDLLTELFPVIVPRPDNGVPGVIRGKCSVRKRVTKSPSLARHNYILKNNMFCCM